MIAAMSKTTDVDEEIPQRDPREIEADGLPIHDVNTDEAPSGRCNTELGSEEDREQQKASERAVKRSLKKQSRNRTKVLKRKERVEKSSADEFELDKSIEPNRNPIRERIICIAKPDGHKINSCQAKRAVQDRSIARLLAENEEHAEKYLTMKQISNRIHKR